MDTDTVCWVALYTFSLKCSFARLGVLGGCFGRLLLVELIRRHNISHV
jgi:hypothetical protein